MLKIITIIGARPQIIKAAAISRIIRNDFKDFLCEKILHTGQHYDHNMSNVFFEEMNIPKPDYQLSITSEKQGEQTALMISGIEKVLLENKTDIVILYGDTNSTLAGSIAASKIQIPIVHIEAGLRSHNKKMPEELNRIFCDYASTLLFCPTNIAVENLKKENLFHSMDNTYTIDNKGIFLSGDVMYDNALYYSKIAESKSEIINKLELSNQKFLLCTIHRAYNTDNVTRLKTIFEGLNDICKKYNLTVVIPLHPRTKSIISKHTDLQHLITKNSSFRIIEPVSYFDMIRLEKESQMILTDSGGVQKEAFFFKKPCIILRSETEWKELTDNGNAIIADADKQMILSAFEFFMLNENKLTYKPFYGDGNAARFICEILKNSFI